jgi:apolipoprotein N-acyltransferase
MRAVEEGLPLIRVANTGISTVIDAYGRMLVSIPLGQRFAIEAALPPAQPQTLFSQFGSKILIFIVLAGLLVASWLRRPCED